MKDEKRHVCTPKLELLPIGLAVPVFRLWEETGEHGENPPTQSENLHSPCRKALLQTTAREIQQFIKVMKAVGILQVFLFHFAHVRNLVRCKLPPCLKGVSWKASSAKCVQSLISLLVSPAPSD